MDLENQTIYSTLSEEGEQRGLYKDNYENPYNSKSNSTTPSRKISGLLKRVLLTGITSAGLLLSPIGCNGEGFIPAEKEHEKRQGQEEKEYKEKREPIDHPPLNKKNFEYYTFKNEGLEIKMSYEESIDEARDKIKEISPAEKYSKEEKSERDKIKKELLFRQENKDVGVIQRITELESKENLANLYIIEGKQIPEEELEKVERLRKKVMRLNGEERKEEFLFINPKVSLIVDNKMQVILQPYLPEGRPDEEWPQTVSRFLDYTKEYVDRLNAEGYTNKIELWKSKSLEEFEKNLMGPDELIETYNSIQKDMEEEEDSLEPFKRVGIL